MTRRRSPPLGRSPFLLLALCATLYLPGLQSVPVTDRDEARFAQATRQMLETGDWININFQNEPRHKKPILTHWAQAATIRATAGSTPDSDINSIARYRLASALAATAAVVLLVLLWGKHQQEHPLTTPTLAAALLASSLLVIVEAHLATSDALLLATVVTAQCALWRIYAPPDTTALPHSRIWWPILFWIALALGILTKGPVLPALALLTVITLCLADRSLSLIARLRLWLGIPIVLAIITPWLWAVQNATDNTFLKQAILEDFWPKLISSQESHGLPPGFYLITIPLFLWPGSLVTGLALSNAWKQRRADTAERFLLAWIIPFWLVLELVPTKLPHYALPLYPALCLLTARFIMNNTTTPATARIKALAPRLGFILWLIIGIALAAAPIAGLSILSNHRLTSLLGISTITAAAVSVTLMLAAVTLGAWKQRLPAAAIYATAATIPLTASIFIFALPNMNRLWVSRSIADIADQYRDTTASIAVFSYHEPSVVFETATATRLAFPNSQHDPLADLPTPILCFLPADNDQDYIAILDTLAATYRITQRLDDAIVEGLNYSKGQPVRLVPVILDRILPSEEPGR